MLKGHYAYSKEIFQHYIGLGSRCLVFSHLGVSSYTDYFLFSILNRSVNQLAAARLSLSATLKVQITLHESVKLFGVC